jgi:predicted NUDIX family phosphoesterase
MTNPCTLPKKYAEERVIVLPYTKIQSLFPGTGVWPIQENLLQSFGGATTMRRDDAERTVDFTQLVSYFVITHGTTVLTHRRTKRQPEKRLTSVRAVGFSGHMTDSDLHNLVGRDFFHQDGRSGYANRELAEEVSVHLHSDTPIALRCCIWEPIDDFGKQHLGLVYEVPTDGSFRVLEPGLIADALFESVDDVRARVTEYSSWSRLLLERSSPDDLMLGWR